MSSSFATPWTVVLWPPLLIGFPRQEYWSGLPFPSPEDLSNPGIEPVSPALASRFFTTEPHTQTQGERERERKEREMCVCLYNNTEYSFYSCWYKIQIKFLLLLYEITKEIHFWWWSSLTQIENSSMSTQFMLTISNINFTKARIFFFFLALIS